MGIKVDVRILYDERQIANTNTGCWLRRTDKLRLAMNVGSSLAIGTMCAPNSLAVSLIAAHPSSQAS
jgi:hypothetical protein